MIRVAIIPARSGSKGLKNKNIINLCGFPLIYYTIDAAIKSHVFDRIIVSTDSKLYGEIAQQYGAEVLYRDENLSNDSTPTFFVVEDVLKKIDGNIDYFALLQPTSPMRNDEHIVDAVNSFDLNYENFDFLASVKEADYSKSLVNRIDEDNSLKYFSDNYSNYRRQLFKEYTPNGAIFLGKIDSYLCQRHFFGKKSLSYKMSKVDSIDIDDEVDYELAKIYMRKRLQELNCE